MNHFLRDFFSVHHREPYQVAVGMTELDFYIQGAAAVLNDKIISIISRYTCELLLRVSVV